jgi:hypothetical protein
MNQANDQWAVRAVVVLLGLTVIACLALIGLLSMQNIPVPDTLGNITSAALGGLTALLVSTHTGQSQEPVPVSGPGGGSDPVKVTETR